MSPSPAAFKCHLLPVWSVGKDFGGVWCFFLLLKHWAALSGSAARFFLVPRSPRPSPAVAVWEEQLAGRNGARALLSLPSALAWGATGDPFLTAPAGQAGTALGVCTEKGEGQIRECVALLSR